jgi:hypothetical protein
MWEWLSNLGSGIGGLFGSGSSQPTAPATSYGGGVYDPGGLTEFNAGGNIVYAPPAASAPSPGFGDWLTRFAGGAADVLSGAPKWLDPALKLGATGLGAASSIMGMQRGAEQNQMLRDEQRRLASIAGPAAAAGGSLTAAGSAALTGGPLPAGLEAMVDKFKTDAMMKYRQYLSDTGQTDSSAALQMEAYIEREAAMYRQQLAEGLLQQGYGGISAALGPSGTAAYTAAGALGANQRDLAQGASALGKIMGSTG